MSRPVPLYSANQLTDTNDGYGTLGQESSAPHEVEVTSYKSPTFCDHCGEFLIGLIKQGVKCRSCGENLHTKCVSLGKCTSFVSRLAPSTGTRNSPHRMVEHSFTSPTICRMCDKMLLGLTKQGLRCSHCLVPVHKNCARFLCGACQSAPIVESLISFACPGETSRVDQNPSSLRASEGALIDLDTTPTIPPRPVDSYDLPTPQPIPAPVPVADLRREHREREIREREEEEARLRRIEEEKLEEARMIEERFARLDLPSPSLPSSSTPSFSRCCPVCLEDSPPLRVVFTSCGHVICSSCADQMKTQATSATRLKCPVCRANCGFVRLFE